MCVCTQSGLRSKAGGAGRRRSERPGSGARAVGTHTSEAGRPGWARAGTSEPVTGRPRVPSLGLAGSPQGKTTVQPLALTALCLLSGVWMPGPTHSFPKEEMFLKM